MIRRTLALALLLCLLGARTAQATPADFVDGVKAYNNKDYAAAITAFEAVAAHGAANAALYYDLGNAYLKTKNLGQALLWYERAARLAPDDPDLRFNLEYARSLVKDAGESQAGPLRRVLFFWCDVLTPRTLQLAAIGANLALWLLVGVCLFRRNRLLRGLRSAALVAVLLLAPSAGYQLYEQAFIKQGILLNAQTPVRSGRTEDATKLFELHAGSKVRVAARTNGWFKIRFGPDKIGWVPADAVGII